MPAEHHIRNPFEMAVEQFATTVADAAHLATTRPAARPASGPLVVRTLTTRDLTDALRAGAADFVASRGDAVFLAIVYPLAGLLLAQLALNHDLLPLVFPLASGFALIGPIAAVGLYEISRRREAGAEVAWTDALGVLRSPALLEIIELGLVLAALFLAWLAAAYGIFQATLGPAPPESVTAFLGAVFTTPQGWVMIVAGTGVGFVAAAITLTISAVSFPLLLDRGGGVGRAIATSVRVVVRNPRTMALWGLIVAGGLVAGCAPAMAGLIIVIPLLGHATWHLYRKAVAEA